MKEITLYTTHCPRCKVLETKMSNAHIKFHEVTNIDEIQKLGIMSVPMLKVDGKIMDFATANAWINKEVKSINEN